jgi:hypothetical protein
MDRDLLVVGEPGGIGAAPARASMKAELHPSWIYEIAVRAALTA